MPPVFGPSSPSSSRLKSWAGASGRTFWPSESAKSETSSPSSSSSTTTSPPSARARTSAASASSWVRQTNTPLPAARPSALTTQGARASSRTAAVGTAAASSTSLAKAFDPSMRAAALLGPNTATPARRSSSAMPATSGASGPTTTRWISCWRQRPRRPSTSSMRIGWQRPSAAIPGFPGAACSSVSRSLCAIFHASACSRPPDPRISTFTRASLRSRAGVSNTAVGR